jgi:uncharacterized XkdX family phage protein
MFNFWNNMFKMERITEEKLKEVVVKGFITAEEYKQITGEDYTN